MIRLHFVPREQVAPAVGYWNASKRGDEAVDELAPVLPLRPVATAGLRAPLPHQEPAPAIPPPARARRFRFTFKLVIEPKIDGLDPVVIYEGDTYELADRWDGNSGRACLALEDDLQRLVLRPGRRVVVLGGYV